MVSPLRISLMLLMMLIAPLTWAVNLEVKLDSEEIAAGDTVNLTVTVDEQAFGEAPDFSPLKQDFDILSNRQSSQFSMSNGQISSTSSWILTLLPKREGFIAIPPLRYGSQTSKPLKLRVTERRRVDSTNSNEVIFMDAQVDKKDVYVQEQVIYTVRLYRRVDLHESSYTPPTVDNAVMEALGNQREYTSTVDGRSYKIIELRYAVFPQKSGELVIPPARIVGTIFLGNNRGFFDPFNGRQIRRQTPSLTLNVRPQPAAYPADKPWLPARSLQLRESWTPDEDTLSAGEPVTRQIILEAEGLAQSVLPPLSLAEQDGVKIYPEQPEIASNIGPRGMLSTRKENFAIIATHAGTLTLPPLEVTWWDVDEEKIKVAKLPARTLKVSGTARHAQTDALPQAPARAQQLDESAPASLQASGNSLWQWIALVALLLWLSTLAVLGYLYWRRRQAPTTEPESKPAAPFSRQQEKAARAALQTACNSHDAPAARRHLIALYRQIFKTAAVHNLDDVLQLTPDDDLAQALQALDAALYKDGNSHWQGSGLIHTVDSALEKRAKDETRSASQLAPLFPT